MKMSKSLLLTLTLTALFNTQNASAFSLFNPLKNDAVNQTKDVYAGIKFHYLDREDRLLIVNDFLKTVELEYALLPLKIKKLGLDFAKLKADAVAAETNIESITISAEGRKDALERERISALQAISNMQFLDRMQALVAQFQDTHFGLQEKIARPFVYTGLRLYRINNKVMVGALEKKFLSLAAKMSGADFSRIAIGDEVLAINGRPVEEKINELKKYLNSSSDEFADYQAVRALTIRNFSYEQSNSITITFKNAGIFKLPLFANTAGAATPRLDAITFFNKFNIPMDSQTIGLDYDPSARQWVDTNIGFEGYSPAKLHLNLKGLVEMKGDDGSAALRSGYYISKGKTYGVLQILTFNTKNVKVGETSMSFIDGVRSFVAELKENQIPLILDLRINGGGNGNLPAQVLSVIAPEGAVYPGATSGLRMTAYTRQLTEPNFFQEIVGEDQSFGLTSDELFNVFQETIENHKEFSPMFAGEVIPFDMQKIKGFNNKVVALVSANCISACDKMSFLLKSSKRATIIGTHSNGTGAGFRSTSELNTKWEDRLRVLSTQVPNYLFGLPGKSIEDTVFGENSVEEMCTENRPTVADVKYAPTLLDVAKNNTGWLQKAIEVLEAQQ